MHIRRVNKELKAIMNKNRAKKSLQAFVAEGKLPAEGFSQVQAASKEHGRQLMEGHNARMKNIQGTRGVELKNYYHELMGLILVIFYFTAPQGDLTIALIINLPNT